MKYKDRKNKILHTTDGPHTAFIPVLNEWLHTLSRRTTSNIMELLHCDCRSHVGDSQQVHMWLSINLSGYLREVMHLSGMIKLWRLCQETEGSLFFSLTTKLKAHCVRKRAAVHQKAEWNLKLQKNNNSFALISTKTLYIKQWKLSKNPSPSLGFYHMEFPWNPTSCLYFTMTIVIFFIRIFNMSRVFFFFLKCNALTKNKNVAAG